MRQGIPEDAETWRPLDEAVVLQFTQVDGAIHPERIRWRGADWGIVGPARHWSTWRALPVLSTGATRSTAVRGMTADFWRFHAQTDPVGLLLHFEVRRAGHEWRLVRLGATFAVPDR
jgi:hypothetical protein